MQSQFKSLIFSLGNLDKRYYQGRISGPYRIATELRSRGWDVEVIDFFYAFTLEELKQLVISRYDENLKFIGIGHLFNKWTAVEEDFFTWVKETYPHLVIIYGSVIYDGIKSKAIDYYIKGYAENALMELLNYLFSNGKRPIITPIGGAKVILAEQYYSAAPWKNPLILYEDRDFLQPWEWGTVEFSRGCKFQCAFCNFPLLGVKGDWTRDSDNFELQMKDAYDRFGITKYLVSDETFNDSTEKITKFADVVEKLPFTPFYSGFIRGDLLISRPADREELLRMNFLSHFYGIESFEHDSAKAIGKGMHPDRVKQGLLDVRKYFKGNGRGLYRGNISIIFGLPADTVDYVWNTYDWIKANWQGEAFDVQPLEIYKHSEFNANAKLTELYPKLGYEEMSEDEILNESGNKDSMMKFRKDMIYWKNKNTNYFEMDRLANEIDVDRYNHDFRSNTFAIMADTTGDSIDKTLEKPYNLDSHFYKTTTAFHALYKQKKLSL